MKFLRFESSLRRLTRTSALWAVLFSFPYGVFAQQVNGAGSTSTNFQKIGMGARAVGMGESFISVADDSTSSFWNPAGLIMAQGTQFSITHGEWLIGVTHEFFAFSQNIDKDGAFGAVVGYLGSGTFPGALEDPFGNYGGVGPDIHATSFIGSLSYAQRLGNWFNGNFWRKSMLGLKATVVGQDLMNNGAAGLAFDLGYLYEITKKKFYVGAVLENLGTSIQDFSQPLRFKVGGSYRFYNLLMKKDRNLVSLDLDGHIDTGFKVNFGDEYRLRFGKSAVALRLGYRSGSDLGTLAGMTGGLGLAQKFDDFDLMLDYAFVPYGVLGETHRVSLSFASGEKLDKPLAFVTTPKTFLLGQQSLPVRLSVKSEDPLTDWKVNIKDKDGNLVKTFEGKGAPPDHFLWDGKDKGGQLVAQGDYTFTMEVTNDEDTTGQAEPRQSFARWVPKRVPYQYSFQVPGDLLFDSAKAELKPKGYETIEKYVGAIQRRYPDSMIIIAGHTDNQKLAKGAKFRDNQQLSEARAKAVVDYLTSKGVSGTRLSAVGYGESKPLASNDSEAGRAKNRRVELVVSGVMDATASQLIEEGMTLLKVKNYREALERFLKAIESDARNAKAYHLAGDCYLTLGGKPQAIQAYRKALALDPKDTDLKNWLQTYAPEPGAPVDNPQSAPAPSPASDQPSAPASDAGQPASPQTQPAPAAQPATGMPVPVGEN